LGTTICHDKGLSALSAYTKGCRCDICTTAKIKYEAMRKAKKNEEEKAKRKLVKKTRPLDHDTMTISEYKKHREETEAKRQFN